MPLTAEAMADIRKTLPRIEEAKNDRKRREPFEIRGTVSYVCDLADDGDTVEVEVEATSVTMAAPKDDGGE